MTIDVAFIPKLKFFELLFTTLVPDKIRKSNCPPEHPAPIPVPFMRL
jgi:hypothetical protein